MTNLKKHDEMLDKFKKRMDDSYTLETELRILIQNDEIHVKIVNLIYRLSKKNYPVWRECITTTIERLKNGETAESILADLEKRVEDIIYVKRSDFKTNLAFIRKESGLTQSQLAEASGVNVRMIQHYEQGVKDINGASALTVYRLAETLGTTVGELLEIKK